MNAAERIKKVYELYDYLDDKDIIENIAEVERVDGEKRIEIKDIEITEEWKELSTKAEYYTNKFSRLNSIYMLVLGDFADFNRIRNRLENHAQYPEANKDLESLPRLFMHILSSGVLFLTYLENFMKEHYGKDSNEAKKMKSKLSEFYDNEFVYRFMYELRNYSQHKEIPVQTINFQLINHPKKKARLDIEINTNRLLQSGYRWKKIFRDDFSERHPIIKVRDLLRDYFETITLVYGAANEIYLKKDVEEIIRIKEALDQIYSTSSPLFIARITKVDLAYNPTNYNMIPFPSQYNITKIMVDLSKMGLVKLNIVEK